ncbi:nuclear transport factor 2 family protein (plasmid) [Rhizobium sp. T1470]|nr:MULTISPECIES: nuclear transport factor 2 family protein [Rhizobium]UFS80504.1 nuclear transport factor 2 family protein [Rhizobium sp. T136]
MTMVEYTGQATAIACTYIEAIASRDLETILKVSAQDVVCTSPMGKLTGAQAFRGFHEGFARMIKSVNILAVYGDDDQAVIIYEADTHPVPRAVTVELITVNGGKIASTDVIYDSAPFAEYMATVKPH